MARDASYFDDANATISIADLMKRRGWEGQRERRMALRYIHKLEAMRIDRIAPCAPYAPTEHLDPRLREPLFFRGRGRNAKLYIRKGVLKALEVDEPGGGFAAPAVDALEKDLEERRKIETLLVDRVAEIGTELTEARKAIVSMVERVAKMKSELSEARQGMVALEARLAALETAAARPRKRRAA